MEFIDFFEDPETGKALPNPFKTGRGEEVWRWLRKHRGQGKIYGPGELTRELLKKKTKLEQEANERKNDSNDRVA